MADGWGRKAREAKDGKGVDGAVNAMRCDAMLVPDFKDILDYVVKLRFE